MKRSKTQTLLLSALSLAAILTIAGCKTVKTTDGVGYQSLTPLPATAVHIARKDPAFARQVAAHNRQCRKDAGCN